MDFCWISGNDPIFQHIINLGRFDNGLYWVAYNNNTPNKIVNDFLETPNTNASIIKGYDSDSFMLKLNTELGLDQPKITNKPFTCVKEMLNNIVDIEDDEHFKGIKERLEISKTQVDEAIKQFEEGKIASTKTLKIKSEINILKREIIEFIVNEEYKLEKIETIESKVLELKDNELTGLLASLYFNWGTDLGDLARAKEGKEAEQLFKEAFDKLEKDIEFGGNYHNLSCLYALKKEIEKALKYLDISLSRNEISVGYIKKDDDWKAYQTNENFIKLLSKYK